MVETNIIKHNGKIPEYLDEVMLYTSNGIFVTLIDGHSYSENMSEDERNRINEFKHKVRILFQSDYRNSSFNTLCEVVDNLALSTDGYSILHINENKVESYIKGGTEIKLVTDGKILSMSNGVYYLDETDSIIMATKYFYSLLTEEGILIDALLSETCTEWSRYLMNRISDINHLECYNLSACTIRYKKTKNNGHQR